MDIDYLLWVDEMYHRALRDRELEVVRLTHELMRKRGFLEGAHTTLQESDSRLEELLEETGQRYTKSISTKSHICFLVTLLEDFRVS
jgi:hypothetical protein